MASRRQATYSSTPASLIYAQSWPVPSSHSLDKRKPSKPISNSIAKSLNSPWTCKPKKNTAKPEQASSPTKKVLKQSYVSPQSHSWAISMLNNNYPEWIEEERHVELDMAKEFRLTLQMFKKLTQQVQEVDEKLNSTRKPYSFKHYFSDSPGIHWSQLAANMRCYTPEVPMTNQAYEPCNNFGCKREIRRPHSHLGVYQKNEKIVSNMTQKPKADAWCSSTSKIWKKSVEFQAGQKKSSPKQNCQQTLKQENLKPRNINNFLWLSSPGLSNDKPVSFGYIDPVPNDWDKRKLEELEQEFCSAKKNKVDPFTVRYLQLRRLEADTLENERHNPKIEESAGNSNVLNTGSVKTHSNGQCKKLGGDEKHSTNRSCQENIKPTEKNCYKKSRHSHLTSSCYVFTSDVELSNTGSTGKSCISNCGVKEKNQTFSMKRGKCSSARARRKVCSSSNSKKVHSAKSYQCCSVGHYDIVELASSFTPPCEDRIKFKSRPVTAKSARSKGLLPGKSMYSQRRYSLTSDQVLLPMASETDLPSDKSSSSKGRQKFAKRNTRQCASSQL